MRNFLLIFSLSLSQILTAQNMYQDAYNATNHVPVGLLEAVAWTNTHMVHLDGTLESCSGIPQPFGIMGLHDDGANYFKQNAQLVSQLSGISLADQASNPSNQVLAYALAYDAIITNNNFDPNNAQSYREVLHILSEIPDTGYVNFLAKEMQVYSILKFMCSNEMGQLYNFNPHHINLATYFGAQNYAVLSANRIVFTNQGIRSENNDLFTIDPNKSNQYGPAIWNPAPACNFSSRNGIAISAITIHTVQGTYAGAISWAQNCASSVSYHYVVRSTDGQITQMVLEEDKAWHVGSENPYTIGYEHEGYVNDPSWYTEAMYQNSADLSRDIVNSGYGIPAFRTYFGPSSAGSDVLGGCTKIKGHQHFPNQTHTDPGIYWDWEKYYRLINNPYSPIVYTSPTGNLYDSGGSAGNYQDDERILWLIQPPNANTITLNFTEFNIENDWDYLFIYDGDSIDAPLINVYTGTNSPGTLTSTGGSLLLEFRSDCSTVAPGWAANYTTITVDNVPPTTVIVPGSLWQTNDFTVTFNDQDTESGIKERYILVSEKMNGTSDWYAQGSYSFANESFDLNSILWTPVTGSFNINNGAYVQSDLAEQNSNSHYTIEQNNNYSYLYNWNQTITSTDINQRAGLHFFCDNPSLPNRGNSYFVYIRENDNKLQIYSVSNDVFTLQQDVSYAINSGQTYNCKVRFSPLDGIIDLYIDGTLEASWQDSAPLQAGNSISFRTGGCSATFDDLKVYRSRGQSEIINVGISELMSIQSEGAIHSGRINSIVLDSANNWSTEHIEDYLIDYTTPTIDYLFDGLAQDIDTFYTAQIEANWSAIDIHSDIVEYIYAVGTLPNLDDVVQWTSGGVNNSMLELIANPIYDQVYHVSIKVSNGAGLEATYVSNGQRYLEGLGLYSEDLSKVTVYPNPAINQLTISGIENCDYLIMDNNGKVVERGNSLIVDLSQLSNGQYTICVISGQQFVNKKFIVMK